MKRFALIAVLLTTVLFGAAMAHGEISGNGGLFVSFNGGFAPRSLPRDRNVPVTVNLHVSIKTANGARPPQLRRISLAVNRYGRLSIKGLPICRPALLESTDPPTALARCRRALVGRGRFIATVAFPNRDPFPVNGEMLAFNGRAHGKPAILLHIHGTNPVDVTVVLSFTIQHPSHGKFGTVLTTKIPKLASDLGYVSDVALLFNRQYSYHGRHYSFLSARCAAPSGFPGAIFSFTRGTFSFAGGKQIHTTLTRDCVVR
ncbi:MAG TPA: hypothetical protein VKC63_01765 [Solirubrobacterales bacterium]|nr:hypothetical protein [Solirubrobacterales bacterium]